MEKKQGESLQEREKRYWKRWHEHGDKARMIQLQSKILRLQRTVPGERASSTTPYEFQVGVCWGNTMLYLWIVFTIVAFLHREFASLWLEAH